MNKYLSFTTGAGVEFVKASAILYVERVSATEVHLHELTGAKKVKLVCVGATQAFIDAINEALKTAAETMWTKAVVEVPLTGVTSITSMEIA